MSSLDEYLEQTQIKENFGDKWRAIQYYHTQLLSQIDDARS